MAGKRISLAPLTAAEQALGASIVGATATAGGITLGSEALADLAGLPGSFRDRGGEFWLAKAGGAVIATVGVRPSDAPAWSLEYLCVQPAWRGMGIGRMLAERAVDFARARGADRMLASCPAGAGPLRALLAGIGFQEVSPPPDMEGGSMLMRRIFA